MVAKFHCIRDLISLSVVWDDTLKEIIIQGHNNTEFLLVSKVTIILIGCLLVNHDWTTKGSKKVSLIVKPPLEVLPERDLWIKVGLLNYIEG